MKILGMGVPELVIILIVALLIFGPKNLPKLGSALGQTVKNLREGMGSVQEKVDETLSDDEEEVVEEEVEVLALEAAEEESGKEEVKKSTAKKTTKKVVKKAAE